MRLKRTFTPGDVMKWRRVAINFDSLTFSQIKEKGHHNDLRVEPIDCRAANVCPFLDSGCHMVRGVFQCLCSLDLKPVDPINGCDRRKDVTNASKGNTSSTSTTKPKGGAISGLDLNSILGINKTIPAKEHRADELAFLGSLEADRRALVICSAVVVCAFCVLVAAKSSKVWGLFKPRTTARSPSPPSKGSLSRCQYVNNPNYTNTDSALLPDLETLINGLLIKSDQITFSCEIGEGAFGKVFKGKYRESDSKITTVAIKVLKNGSNVEREANLRREFKILSKFSHPNIVKLLGVLREGDGEETVSSLVLEFMASGDLSQLLRQRSPRLPKLCLCHPIHLEALLVPASASRGNFQQWAGERRAGCSEAKPKQENEPKSEDAPTLTTEQLIWISSQVANAMVYLSSHHFIHRDIAARNCLVTADLTVKLSDFGMSRDIYSSEYYTVKGGQLLPIRWMSPESILYGKFTLESDVWAYGVLLWEIFTFGVQPFFGHTNEQAKTLTLQGILLSPPKDCPDFIKDLMRESWRSEPKDRVSFPQILTTFLNYCSPQQRDTLLSWKDAGNVTYEDYLVPNSVLIEKGSTLEI